MCDSGLTLDTVHKQLLSAGAASVKSLVILDKQGRRKVEYVPDYIGFQVAQGPGMHSRRRAMSPGVGP